jgi:hypothetical protein
METFDLPENSVSCARRKDSVVPPQAHSLLNGALAIQAARDFAARIQREAPDNPSRQVEAITLQRKPSSDEHRGCLVLLRSRNLTELCRALLNLNEFIYVD